MSFAIPESFKVIMAIGVSISTIAITIYLLRSRLSPTSIKKEKRIRSFSTIMFLFGLLMLLVPLTVVLGTLADIP